MGKFVDEVYCDEYEVWTPDGWKDFKGVAKTVEYKEWRVVLEDSSEIICADTHIFVVEGKEIFCKNLRPGDFLDTEIGLQKVVSVEELESSSNMYDLIDVDGSVYYTNGIVSHNTTTLSLYALWYVMFNKKKFVGIVSNNAASAQEILRNIKEMYLNLPNWLKPGVANDWNKRSVVFENGCRIQTAATSPNAFRGRSLNLLIADEFAFVPANMANAFWASNYPTLSASDTAKVCLISTPQGSFNLFHEIYSRARTREELETYKKALEENDTEFLDQWNEELREGKKNAFVRAKFSWRVVPGRDDKWRDQELGNIGRVRFSQEYECLSPEHKVTIQLENGAEKEITLGELTSTFPELELSGHNHKL